MLTQRDEHVSDVLRRLEGFGERPDGGWRNPRRLLALAAIVVLVAAFVGLTLWMASVAAGHLGA